MLKYLVALVLGVLGWYCDVNGIIEDHALWYFSGFCAASVVYLIMMIEDDRRK